MASCWRYLGFRALQGHNALLSTSCKTPQTAHPAFARLRHDNHQLTLTPHQLLNSAGLLLITQAILLLQPTHTASQKRLGAYIHSALNFTGILALMGGLAVIVYNKEAHHGAHFTSAHARLGLTVYILFAIQALVGAAAFYTPAVFGGVSRAKATYKYHRVSGYLVVVLSLAAVATATQTDFNRNVLHIRLWAVLAVAVILLIGVLPRIKKQKLGL